MTNNLNLLCFKKVLEDAKSLNTDLLEMTEHENSCPLCAKYEGRVYSISGNDKRFPKLPDIILKTGSLHEGCRHSFSPFMYGINHSTYGYKDIVEFSNRPFTNNDDKSKYRQIDSYAYTMKNYKESVDRYSKNIDFDKINKQNEKLFKKNVINKYNSLNEIKRISPGIMYKYTNVASATLSPEYHLQQKATIYKKEKKIDLAIECLKKSNELMPYSKFTYEEKNYLRLVEYLKLAGKIDEAQKEEDYIRKSLLYTRKNVTFIDYLKYVLRL